MTLRKYSIEEIDSMRASLNDLAAPLHGGLYTPIESTVIEDRLRTYMANGTDPDELTKKCHDRFMQYIEDAKK